MGNGSTAERDLRVVQEIGRIWDAYRAWIVGRVPAPSPDEARYTVDSVAMDGREPDLNPPEPTIYTVSVASVPAANLGLDGCPNLSLAIGTSRAWSTVALYPASAAGLSGAQLAAVAQRGFMVTRPLDPDGEGDALRHDVVLMLPINIEGDTVFPIDRITRHLDGQGKRTAVHELAHYLDARDHGYYWLGSLDHGKQTDERLGEYLGDYANSEHEFEADFTTGLFHLLDELGQGALGLDEVADAAGFRETFLEYLDEGWVERLTPQTRAKLDGRIGDVHAVLIRADFDLERACSLAAAQEEPEGAAWTRR